MRFYTRQHRFYCGVDLHARTLSLCILDGAGQVVDDKKLAADPDAFRKAVAPFRDGRVGGVECLFCWYGLADLCAKEQIAFVLGHALYRKASHGGISKNDQIDPARIARLRRGGTLCGGELVSLLGRSSGTDEILGRGGVFLHSARSWQRMGCWTLKMCLVQLRAETSKPNVAGAVSAKEVNSDPRALREEEGILQISRCALLTLRP